MYMCIHIHMCIYIYIYILGGADAPSRPHPRRILMTVSWIYGWRFPECGFPGWLFDLFPNDCFQRILIRWRFPEWGSPENVCWRRIGLFEWGLLKCFFRMMSPEIGTFEGNRCSFWLGKRDFMHHHLLETISGTANVLESRRWWWRIKSWFRWLQQLLLEMHCSA